MRALRAAAVAVAAVAIASVAFVAVWPAERGTPLGSPSPSPTWQGTRHTGIADLDAIIDAVLTADASALSARFDGVKAREGALVGGPFGLHQQVTVTTTEWTSRLGTARRQLHAVVYRPEEPFESWDQPPPGFPRAAIFAGARDHDIVLVVTSNDGSARPWRFSVANGRVVDVVIDSGGGLGGSTVSLVRRLGYLTPSPDREPSVFLVIPPQEMRPAPPRLAPRGSAPPAPLRAPALAPEGRTGNAALDGIIDELVRADASRLLGRYADQPGRQERCDPNCEDVRLAPSAWTARLASADRSLFSVFTGDPSDAEVVIAARTRTGAAEAWQFSVQGGRVVLVSLHLRVVPPAGVAAPPIHAWLPGHPSPARDHERFYVLPPEDALPKAPRVHTLSTRTGRGGADALLAALEARDAARLAGSFADPASPVVRVCGGTQSRKDAAYVASWSQATAKELYGIHSVSTLPEGYQPQADHLLIAYVRLKPYWWEAMGILERGGRIVMLMTREWTCAPEQLYPPTGYVVPPPPGGVAGLDPARRSGLPLVDRILDAAARRDETAMSALIEYTPTACGDPTGLPPHAGPPPCPSGVAPGTRIDILPEVVCSGSHVTRERAPKTVIDWVGFDRPSGLYAVTSATGSNDLGVVVAWANGLTVVLSVGGSGVKRVSASCGPRHPDTVLVGRSPSFVLPPP